MSVLRVKEKVNVHDCIVTLWQNYCYAEDKSVDVYTMEIKYAPGSSPVHDAKREARPHEVQGRIVSCRNHDG